MVKISKDSQPIHEIDIFGNKHYRLNGELHREDGPAIEYPNGSKSWYYHGKYIDCYSQEELERLIKLKVLW